LNNADFGDADYELGENVDRIIALSINLPVGQRFHIEIPDNISIPDHIISMPLEIAAGTYNAAKPVLAEAERPAEVQSVEDLEAINHIVLDELTATLIVTMLTPEIEANAAKLRVRTTFPNAEYLDGSGVVTETRNLHQVHNQTVELTARNLRVALLDGGFEFTIETELELIDGNNVVIASTSSALVEYRITRLIWNSIHGKLPISLNQEISDRTQSFDLGMLKGFTFRNPQLVLNAKSNVGAHFAINIDNFAVNRGGGNRTVAMFNNETTRKTIFTHNRPQTPGEDAMILNNYILNRDTITNFSALLEGDSDVNFEYSFSIGGIQNDNEAFIARVPAPYIEIVDARAIIPFDVRVTNFSYEDTISVTGADNLPQSIEPEEIFLQLKVENGLPIELTLEITGFFDEHGNPIPAFYTNNQITLIDGGSKKIIPAPHVHDGMVTGGIREAIIPIRLSNANYKGFADLHGIGYKISFNGSNVGGNNYAAVFTMDNGITITAGVYIKADISISDLQNMNE
jgi:hypothetical protein